MKKLLPVLALLVLAACQQQQAVTYNTDFGSGYWRPISAPNVLMPLAKAQAKLEFDVSQCGCGIFPKHIPTPVMAEFESDQARMVETSVRSAEDGTMCAAVPGLVFSECMRGRGWEPTLCAGRLPTQNAGYCG